MYKMPVHTFDKLKNDTFIKLKSLVHHICCYKCKAHEHSSLQHTMDDDIVLTVPCHSRIFFSSLIVPYAALS